MKLQSDADAAGQKAAHSLSGLVQSKWCLYTSACIVDSVPTASLTTPTHTVLQNEDLFNQQMC